MIMMLDDALGLFWHYIGLFDTSEHLSPPLWFWKLKKLKRNACKHRHICSVKRDLCSVKRDLCSVKRDLCSETHASIATYTNTHIHTFTHIHTHKSHHHTQTHQHTHSLSYTRIHAHIFGAQNLEIGASPGSWNSWKWYWRSHSLSTSVCTSPTARSARLWVKNIFIVLISK